jgi:hypothetical protein
MAANQKTSFLPPILTTEQVWQLEPYEYLIEGVILQGDNQHKDGAPLGVVMGLFGPSNIGKTFLLISWILCLVTGAYWCGRRVKKVLVLYFADEGLRGIGTRERGWCARHGYKSVPEYSHCFGMLNLLDAEKVELAGQEIAKWPIRPGLIVIDTFGSAIAAGDEVKDMPKAMTNARRLSVLTGAAVLLNHHPNVAGERERGGGQFRNKVDLLIEMQAVEGANNFRQLTFHKARDDKKADSLLIELCEQNVETPWGMKTTLVVAGPRTALDMPLEDIGKLEQTIRTAFLAAFPGFPDGATWSELYDVANDATAHMRKKPGAKLDRSVPGRVLKMMVEVGEVIDDAAGMEPRPKGARFHLAKIQPATGKDGRSVGIGGCPVDRSVELPPKGGNSLPTDLPTGNQSVETDSTDLYRNQPEVAQSQVGCENGSQTSDLIDQARGQLKKPKGEKPAKLG